MKTIFGLVVITIERYVKIVHPVVYRNHYRRWITMSSVSSSPCHASLTSAGKVAFQMSHFYGTGCEN